MSEFDFVTREISRGLSRLRVDIPDNWSAQFPPSHKEHQITASIYDDVSGFPAFVYQAVFRAADPDVGLFVSGFSRITSEREQLMIAERMEPTLSAMAFTAILTADIRQTFSYIVHHNLPIEDTYAKIPLLNTGVELQINSAELTPELVDMAAICLAEDMSNF